MTMVISRAVDLMSVVRLSTAPYHASKVIDEDRGGDAAKTNALLSILVSDRA